jgi:hypothetical protein
MTTQELNERLEASIALEDKIVAIDRRSASVPTSPALAPMLELQMQIVRTGDLDKLKELRAIEKEWREDQAKQAFNAAFAAFKSEAVKLIRTKSVTDGPLKGKKHVELGEVVRVATPALSKHAMSISWKLTKDEKDWMEVTCTLRHKDGHSETVSMGAAPDAGPGRNAIQARGSAKTYLERYTATAILGLAPEDDDDGMGGPRVESEGMDPKEAQTWADALNNAPSVDALKSVFGDCYNKAKTAKDEGAKKRFTSIYEALKKEFAEGAR